MDWRCCNETYKCKNKTLHWQKVFRWWRALSFFKKKYQGNWSYRFMLHNRSHEIGLGQYPFTSLLRARQLRDQYRLLKDQGQNPLFEKREREEEKRREQGIYFSNVVDQFIKYRKQQWTCPKNEKDWRSSLEKYAYPVLIKNLCH